MFRPLWSGPAVKVRPLNAEQARPVIPNARSTPVVNLPAGALNASLSMFAVPDGL
jgi:hypothetical protein